MIRDILESAAVGKLKGILKDRYGKGLRVKFMQDVSSLEIEEGTYLLKRGDMHIPIQINDRYFATAVVEAGADLKSTDQETVSELVRLFLEPEIFNWYVLQMNHNAQTEPANVVSIYEPQVFEDTDEEEASEQTKTATNILCLQANNPNLIPRVAQNVHEFTERWAYLKFSDIASQVKTAEDIRVLGNLTLFIEDVLQLSPDQQEILYQAISQSSPAEEPLLLIGCTSTVEDLESQAMIHPGLAKLMKAHRIEIERLPRDPKLFQETLEIMLEF
jgi:hypothetical protein